MTVAAAPVSTYRVQFGPDFTFSQAREIAAYFAKLGIGALYASPVWEAKPGSRHGYDVTDPTRVRGVLGGEDGLRSLAAALKVEGVGLILDIVPNHMAASALNPWWRDVLEHGQTSPYERFFDIDWARGPGGRIAIPALGRQLEDVLREGELALKLESQGLVIAYFDQWWPLEVKSYGIALEALLHRLPPWVGANREDVRSLQGESAYLPGWQLTVPEAGAARRAAALELKARWLEALGQFRNVMPLQIDSPDMERLLGQQPYKLEYWRDAVRRLNYRRFFDIGELAALRMENPEVFDALHALPFQLVRDDVAHGLRIDHVDGLFDPQGYLGRLRKELDLATAKGTYLVVEKVLDPDESLPEWPVEGTTGYSFLNALNGVFVDPAGVSRLRSVFASFASERRSYAEIALQAKLKVLEELFAAEVSALAENLLDLADEHEKRDLDAVSAARAIGLVTAALPAYRTYVRDSPVADSDRKRIGQAISEAARRAEASRVPGQAIRLMERVLLGAHSAQERADEARRLRFVMRWQQLTGPAAAKGIEDTALYQYTPLASLDEVGGDPSGERSTIERFHEFNEAGRRWPHSMNATSTHDTKRSEDARARINALSEVPDEWADRLAEWHQLTAHARTRLDGFEAPSPASELLFYQSLAGIWPLDDRDLPHLDERLVRFMVKASREAKVHTSWLDPDERYEACLANFVKRVLDPETGRAFLDSFLAFEEKIAFHGAINSLAQVVLKVASPGLPDFYQGTELWDFSLADPDNRRGVAFDRRVVALSAVEDHVVRDRAGVCAELLSSWKDGRIKLFTTTHSLRTRAAARRAFEHGDYIPATVRGRRTPHLCGFIRRHESDWIAVIVPRLTTGIVTPGVWPLGKPVWDGTVVQLPEGCPALWGNVFTGAVIQADLTTRELPVADALAAFPVALLRGVIAA
ncbi:MAG: malto-oligosyltrehalose synthase [Chloroflexi bacterium]|nr:malto-oligosyltrehalose synthase [Chloroflexota bacterium]